MEERDLPAQDDAAAPHQHDRRFGVRQVLRWIGTGVFVLFVLLAGVIAWLHTAPGRQFIVDQVSQVAPASGLSVKVGRIEGSVLWGSTLYDVEMRDANGDLFLEIPEVDLNWRPYKFPFTGLDIRHLVLHNGTLYGAPELIPGDPDAPTLPDFDIRIDRFVVDDLRIAEGLLGEERVIDFSARTDIADGRVMLDADGELGGGDTLTALIRAEPDGNLFDIDVDYQAPAGGVLASLMGAEESLSARIVGDGTWDEWDGAFVVRQGEGNLAAIRIRNDGGLYRLTGQVRPGDYLDGVTADAVGEAVSLALVGRLQDSILQGAFVMRGDAVNARGQGTVNLADNIFDNVSLEAQLLDPALFGDDLVLDDARVEATLDGPFRDLTVPHRLSIGRLNAGGTIVTGLAQEGTLTWDGTRATLPLDIRATRIVSGNDAIDPRLANGRIAGTVVYTGGQLRSDDLAVRFNGLSADLALSADLNRGAYGVSGPVRASNFTIENIGTVNGRANIQFRMGTDMPWRLRANVNGNMPRVTNATLANLVGQDIRFRGNIALGADGPIVLDNTQINASKLQLALNGRMDGNTATLTGSGRHTEYGTFTVEAEMADDGPRAVLVLDEPLPAAGLRDVRIALAPSENGFAIETQGQSMLGPFDGLVNLVMPEDGPTVIAIDRFNVSRSSITGDLTMGDDGINGALALSGGGLDGTIALAPRGGGQGFDVNLQADNAEFGGATMLSIRQATIMASGVVGDDGATVNGEIRAAGVGYGQFFLGRLVARGQYDNGQGGFDASITGRRGSQFALDVTGQIAPERIAVAARGSYAGRTLSMPRRAVLQKTADGGWQLEPTQLSLGEGIAIAQGRFGGDQPMQGQVSLSEVPLSLADIVVDDLGLGGTVSGVVSVQAGAGGLPTGEARIKVDGLTRSGLVLTSRPMDISLVAQLRADELAARAVMEGGRGATRGRLQALIANLPQQGALPERLYAGDLTAQLRYDGPAASLWRLAAMELIDIRGPLRAAADVTGSLGNPQVRGSLSGDNLRIQSALTGTDIKDVRARGRFVGSRLQLTSFAGTAPNGGRVNGSGVVDLANMSATRGPQIDLRLAARNAQIMDLPTMGATVTGPMRIVSDGTGGTIAGRLRVQEARWQLGIAAEAEQLPDIAVEEVNLPLDYAPIVQQSSPWRYLIDATAPGGIMVDGMGLDSEWRGTVRLRGTTDDPRIGGQVQIVPRQGFYSFAGVRFDITRGIIDFDESAPIDPRLNLLAETEVDGLEVDVTIGGSASQPEIVFSSSQGLPQEELLARLLFGGSVSNLSATDALQLGAALASLRGGGGMGPINQLRSAIGIDRLRLLSADPALNRGTSVALGKNFGRQFYAEIITDGAGYNATEVEFRITSWLSLLASINSLGRGSTSLEYSRDY